jgi:hypothetical protein
MIFLGKVRRKKFTFNVFIPKGVIDQAQKYYQDACTANPDNFSALYGLSQICIAEVNRIET